MNVIEALTQLAKIDPDTFTIEELMAIIVRINSDERSKDLSDPFHPKGLYSPLLNSEFLLEEFTNFFINSLSKCKRCDRCNTRTNVVLGDGLFNSEVFMLTDYPDLIDDRTSTPIAGNIEIKSSNCLCCSNNSECYPNDFNYLSNPSIPCNFIPSTETTFKVETPGNLMFKVLSEGSNGNPNKILSMRKSWSTWFDRFFKEENKRKEWDIESKIYISSLIKCYSSNLPSEEEINICSQWIELERKLCSAKYTLCFGDMATCYLLKRKTLAERWINKPQKVDGWGEVHFFHHPRTIFNSQDQEGMLKELRSILEYCIN